MAESLAPLDKLLAMNTNESVSLREMLVDAIRGHQAHLDFDSAIEDFPVEHRGVKPAGAPHTAWQLLDHMRITQYDILEFSRNPKYKSPEWPEGYWPKTEAPPTKKAWDECVKAFQKDAVEFNQLVQDLGLDLFQPFEHGDGQTLLREALLVASHNSYHLGQLVYLKKMLAA
jgi:DinB family protein